MIRRLFILVALLMPLPAATAIAGSGPVSAAQVRATQVSQGGPNGTSWTYCVNEGSTCTVKGTYDIAFGVNDQYYFAYGVTGSIPCTVAVFGDPDVGTGKGCWILKDTGPAGFTFCVSETRLCTFSGHADVAFGGDGNFNYQYGVPGVISCSDPVFGDPWLGNTKACYIRPDIGPSGYSFCVSEGQTCHVSGTADVAFGVAGKFHYKFGVTGNIPCTDAEFGDPDVGVEKSCYVKPV
jgi:spore coat protein U-like protein